MIRKYRAKRQVKKGYKIVLSLKLESLTVAYRLESFTGEGTELTYFPNKKIRPRFIDGPIAVFSNPVDLKYFRMIMSIWKDTEIKIFKCKYRESRYRKLWYINRTKAKKVLEYEDCPKGTSFADWVILEEEMKL